MESASMQMEPLQTMEPLERTRCVVLLPFFFFSFGATLQLQHDMEKMGWLLFLLGTLFATASALAPCREGEDADCAYDGCAYTIKDGSRQNHQYVCRRFSGNFGSAGN